MKETVQETVQESRGLRREWGVATRDGTFGALSVRELHEVMKAMGIECEGCVEREHLEEALRKHNPKVQAKAESGMPSTPTPPASSCTIQQAQISGIKQYASGCAVGITLSSGQSCTYVCQTDWAASNALTCTNGVLSAGSCLPKCQISASLGYTTATKGSVGTSSTPACTSTTQKLSPGASCWLKASTTTYSLQSCPADGAASGVALGPAQVGWPRSSGANVGPSEFTPGDWVDVQVLSSSGKKTGRHVRARVAAVRTDGGFNLVYPDGTKVVPALSTGIRHWHLRKAAPWVSKTWRDPVDKTLNRVSRFVDSDQAASETIHSDTTQDMDTENAEKGARDDENEKQLGDDDDDKHDDDDNDAEEVNDEHNVEDKDEDVGDEEERAEGDEEHNVEDKDEDVDEDVDDEDERGEGDEEEALGEMESAHANSEQAREAEELRAKVHGLRAEFRERDSKLETIKAHFKAELNSLHATMHAVEGSLGPNRAQQSTASPSQDNSQQTTDITTSLVSVILHTLLDDPLLGVLGLSMGFLVLLSSLLSFSARGMIRSREPQETWAVERPVCVQGLPSRQARAAQGPSVRPPPASANVANVFLSGDGHVVPGILEASEPHAVARILNGSGSPPAASQAPTSERGAVSAEVHAKDSDSSPADSTSDSSSSSSTSDHSDSSSDDVGGSQDLLCKTEGLSGSSAPTNGKAALPAEWRSNAERMRQMGFQDEEVQTTLAAHEGDLNSAVDAALRGSLGSVVPAEKNTEDIVKSAEGKVTSLPTVSLEELVAMGFSEEAGREALKVSEGNFKEAVRMLVQQERKKGRVK